MDENNGGGNIGCLIYIIGVLVSLLITGWDLGMALLWPFALIVGMLFIWFGVICKR